MANFQCLKKMNKAIQMEKSQRLEIPADDKLRKLGA